MPLYHASATILGFGLCLEPGCTFAIGKKFSTKTFWKEARAHNATMIQYVGETCRYLLSAPPQIDPDTGEDLDKKHSIRIAFGNGLRADVFERFRRITAIMKVALRNVPGKGSPNGSTFELATGSGRTVSLLQDLPPLQPNGVVNGADPLPAPWKVHPQFDMSSNEFLWKFLLGTV